MTELASPRPAALPLPRSRRADRAWVAAAAIVVGLVCGMPHVIRAALLSGQGKPYFPLAARSADAVTYDETVLSAPRIREVIEGRLFSADPHGPERKGDVPFLGDAWLDSTILGGLGLVLGRSVPAVFVFCDFALPPLIFLLLFAVCRRLGAELWVAICAALAVLLVDRAAFLGTPQPLEFTRLTTPQLAWVLTAGAILALILTWEQPRPRRAVAAGLLTGACFYSDPYCGSFVLTGAVLLAGAALFLPGQRRSAPMIGLAVLVGIGLAAPVLWQVIAPAGFTGKAELLQRRGVASVARDWMTGWPEAVALLLMMKLNPQRWRAAFPLWLLAVSPVLCIGLSAVALPVPEPWLWLSRCFLPWARLAVVLGLGTWVARLEDQLAAGVEPPRRSAAVPAGFITLCVLFLALGASQQVRFALQTAEQATLPAQDLRALEQLAIRAEPGSVVMCLDADLGALIPVYTACDLWLPDGRVSPAPDTDLLDRAALAAAVYGVPGQVLRQQPGFSRRLVGNTPGGLSAEAVDALVAKAAAYGPRALQTVAKDAPVDLVIWSGYERELGDEELEREFASRLFIEGETLRIYRARKLPRETLEPWPLNLPDFEVDVDGQDDGASNP